MLRQQHIGGLLCPVLPWLLLSENRLCSCPIPHQGVTRFVYVWYKHLKQLTIFNNAAAANKTSTVRHPIAVIKALHCLAYAQISRILITNVIYWAESLLTQLFRSSSSGHSGRRYIQVKLCQESYLFSL